MSAQVQDRMVQEINLFKQLVDLATAKKEALYNNDLEALRQIVEEEEKALMIVERFTPIDYAAVRDTDGFQKLAQERTALITQLKEINLLNQQLLEDALAVVEYSLKLIHGAEENNLYGSSGKVGTGGNQSVINWRG